MTVAATAAPQGFGGGLGTAIGGEIASQDITAGQSAVNSNTAGVEGAIAPYDTFGQSFLQPATTGIGNVAGAASTTEGYDQFMSGYTNTPAAQYQLQQANQAQNSSAAASGNLLSGSNERALGTIDNGIVANNANTAYNEYLSGNNQQFGQLETSLGNMFQAIGVGTTATGQDVSATNAQNSATATLTGQQAQAGQSKGSGIGSMFNGIGSAFAAF
jgi:hypothetical protein